MLTAGIHLTRPERNIILYQKVREQSDGAEFPPGSWIKVCPLCHEVWARFALSGAYTSKAWFSVHAVPCQRCWSYHDWRNIPGSLLFDTSAQRTDWELLDILPLELLHHEVLQHIKAYEHTYPECRLESNYTWHLPEHIDRSQFAIIDTRTGAITPPRS